MGAYIRAGYATPTEASLSIDDVQINEGDAGARSVTFTITLSE